MSSCRKPDGTQTDMVVEVAESSTFDSTGSRKKESHWAWLRPLKPQSLREVVHFLQQDHTHSNKAIPSTPSLDDQALNKWAHGAHYHSNHHTRPSYTMTSNATDHKTESLKEFWLFNMIHFFFKKKYKIKSVFTCNIDLYLYFK